MEESRIPFRERFVAHRGANNEALGNRLPHYPENSLLALQKAYEYGVHYVECDVHKTYDGEVIVLHDHTLRRTARHNPGIVTTLSKDRFAQILDHPVSTLKYEEIGQVDIGCYADYLDPVRCHGQRIPLLREFLQELQGCPNRKLFIEIKEGSGIEIVDAVRDLILGYSANGLINKEQLKIISFDLPLLQRVKQVLPDYQTLFLVITTGDPDEVQIPIFNLQERYKGLYHRIFDKKDLYRILDLTKQAKLDGLGLEYISFIDEDFIRQIHDEGLLAYVWTYPKDDTVEMAMRMVECGVDFIATNQPQYIFEHFTRTYRESEYGEPFPIE